MLVRMVPTLAAISSALASVTVRPISGKSERRRWDELIDERHYLRSHRMVGEQVRQVAVDGCGNWVALIGWCAAADRLNLREGDVGWDDGQRRARLHLAACNARFLILADRGSQPNLASTILARSLERLPADWEAAYGHPVVYAETFVDLRRPRADGSIEEFAEATAGTCYRAVGFRALGLTRGFRRTTAGFERHGIQRLLLVREIAAGARELLRGLTTPWDRRERSTPPTRINLLEMPEAFAPEKGLIAHLLAHVPDPREVHQYSWSCILIGLMGGILAGETTVKGIAAWAKALPEEVIKRIGGRLKKGKRTMPVPNTYRYALEHADLDAFTGGIRSWLAAHGVDWHGDLVHIDGKNLNGSAKRGPGVKTAAAFVGNHRALVAMAMHAGDEREAARKCLRQLDLRGVTVTADALHADLDTTLLIRQKGGTSSSRSKRTSRRSWTPVGDLIGVPPRSIRPGIADTDAMRSAVPA